MPGHCIPVSRQSVGPGAHPGRAAAAMAAAWPLRNSATAASNFLLLRGWRCARPLAVRAWLRAGESKQGGGKSCRRQGQLWAGVWQRRSGAPLQQPPITVASCTGTPNCLLPDQLQPVLPSGEHQHAVCGILARQPKQAPHHRLQLQQRQGGSARRRSVKVRGIAPSAMSRQV